MVLVVAGSAVVVEDLGVVEKSKRHTKELGNGCDGGTRVSFKLPALLAVDDDDAEDRARRIGTRSTWLGPAHRHDCGTFAVLPLPGFLRVRDRFSAWLLSLGASVPLADLLEFAKSVGLLECNTL